MPKLTFKIIDDKLIAPFQHEIENLALKTLGTHHDIYFDYIPLTTEYGLMWSNEKNGWILI